MSSKHDQKAIFAYEGLEIAYNPACITDWAWQHTMAKGPLEQMNAFDQLFCGSSDEVASALEEAGLAPEGTMDAMDRLIQALLKKVGPKN